MWLDILKDVERQMNVSKHLLTDPREGVVDLAMFKSPSKKSHQVKRQHMELGLL